MKNINSQLVQDQPDLFRLDNCREFQRVRREALANRMDEFIKTSAGITG